MQSNNPILTRVETVSDYSQPMTVQGAIQKSVMLTIIAAAVGVALFFMQPLLQMLVLLMRLQLWVQLAAWF